jgi:Replication initiator protein A
MAKKRSSNPTEPTLLPISVDVDLIRFERNLLTLGFFGAADPRNEIQKTRVFEKEIERQGHRVRVKVEFRGSELGLPTTADRDKFIAFLKILNEQKATRGRITNPVRFTGYRMIQELGLTRNAGIYEDIADWGKRMTDSSITSSQVVYLANKKVYTDDTLHVFARFKRSGVASLKDNKDRQEGFEVDLADWLLENLNQRFVVPEDFNAYKKLTRPISKGIFGFLHVAFHATGGRPVEKDYADLCNELGIKSYQYPSKIKSTIGSALNELVKINYLSKWELKRMVTKTGYKIILHVGSELTQFMNKYRSDRKLLAESTPDEPQTTEADLAAVNRLVEHGVLPDRAQLLVHTYGADRVLDIVEYQEAQMTSKRRSIDNPAGLLVYSLENNLPIPLSFITSRKRKAIEANAKAKEEERDRRHQAQMSYMAWAEAELEQAIATRYSASALQRKVQEVVSQRLKTDLVFKRVDSEQRKKIAMQLIRKEIREELDLPTFDEWLSKHSQFTLF